METVSFMRLLGNLFKDVISDVKYLLSMIPGLFIASIFLFIATIIAYKLTPFIIFLFNFYTGRL